MIALGQTGRDVITGFEGVCIGRAQYLTGCNQALLVPRRLTPDGKRIEGEWFDEQRIERVDAVPIAFADAVTQPGPDKEAPKR